MSGFSKIIRSAGTIGVATLISRILGLVRDMVMARFFGTGMVAEAFYVAFMIPALLRRLVGEGSLTVAFISVFTKFRQEHGEEEARLFLRSFWTLMTIVLAAMVLAGMLFSREVVTIFTNPQFRIGPSGAETPQFALAVVMTRQMFPYLFLIGLTALAMGILNSYKHFFAPSFHPVLLNLSWISCVAVLHGRFEQAGLAVVIGVLAGGVLQLLLQVPFLLRAGMSFVPRFNFRHPAIRRIGLLMLPSTLAVGVVQINTLISTYFVTAFPGARSQIFYANRLTEFPYAIFSLAIATAVLPTLSEQAGSGDYRALRETLDRGLKLVAFIIIPASVGLAVISRPFIHIVFEHGAFTALDNMNTSAMVAMFCLGLWAVAGLRLVIQAFYAVEDMTTPLWAAAMGLAANAIGCWALPQVMGRAGVPLAISIAAVLNLLVLWARLPSRIGSLKGSGLGRTMVVALVASAPMGTAIVIANNLELWSQPGNMALKTLVLLIEVGAGALIYAAMARAFKAPELGLIIEIVARRFRGKG